MTDPNRVPGMTPEEIEQAFSETVGPLTFDEQPYDIEESPVSDPTKNVPWCVHDDADRNEPCWSVLDSTGQLVVWFNYGAHYRTKTEAESLARTVAAGPDADRLRARVEQLTNTLEGERVGFRATAKALDALAPERDRLKVELLLIDKTLEELKTPAKHFKTGRPLNRAERVYWGLAFTFVGEMDAEITKLRALAVELAAALGRAYEWTPHDSSVHAELLRRAAAILTPGEQP